MADGICKQCGLKCDLPCPPLNLLTNIYNEQRLQEKKELIANLRKELNIRDAEPAEDLRELAEKVIKAMPELHYILDYDIKVGYIRSYESKKGAKTVFADCRKLTTVYQAYLPYDFLITFYDNEASILTENQQKILMLHELKHIEMGEHGLKIRLHDIEDFHSILGRYGINWNEFQNNDVPDILEGDNHGTSWD